MLFSILIPVYNVERFLKECVESILRQTEEDFEIILVNDGSTDKSGEICNFYAEKYPEKIRVIHQENKGLLIARRTAFQYARGQFCICCDSDDGLKPDALRILKEEIDRSNPDVIIYNMDLQFGKEFTPFSSSIFTNEKRVELKNKSELYKKFLTTFFVNSMACKAIKTSIVDVKRDYTKYVDITNGEDSLQSISIYKNAKSIVYINESLYNYRANESSMTQKFNEGYFSSFLKINHLLEESIKDQNFENKDEYISFHLMIVAYLSITQLKFPSCKLSFTEKKQFVLKIRNNAYFDKKINIYSHMKKDIKKMFNQKQRMILCLLSKRKISAIVVILEVWKKVGVLFKR